MVKHLVCMLVLGFAACSGDPPPAPDAATNLPFGATCITNSDTSTECASGVCTNTFDMLGHNVCSQKCTIGMDATCPSGSSGMKCNMKGYCKP
jgi:hypothetical protein